MTDKFFSGWGMAADKTDKLVISCETFEQAQVVYDNAYNRSEMKYVNIRSSKPYYNSRYYKVDYHGKEQGDYESWFIPNYFKGDKNEL